MPFLGTIGPLEIGVILLIVIILFGAKRLPELGKSLGQGIKNFRKSIGGKDDKEPPAEKPPASEKNEKE